MIFTDICKQRSKTLVCVDHVPFLQFSLSLEIDKIIVPCCKFERDLENPDDHDETFRNPKTTRTPSEFYDLQADFPRPPAAESEKRINLGFQVTKHPFLIENNEYHRIRRLLNRKQQTIGKDIALKK